MRSLAVSENLDESLKEFARDRSNYLPERDDAATRPNRDDSSDCGYASDQAFVPSPSTGNDDDEPQKQRHPRSFLPTYADVDDLVETDASSWSQEDDGWMNQELRLNDRVATPVENSRVEEATKVDENPRIAVSDEEKQKRRNAEVCVAALADLFSLPSIAEDANETADVSSQPPPPPPPAKSVSNASKQQQQPVEASPPSVSPRRRSIFSQAASKYPYVWLLEGEEKDDESPNSFFHMDASCQSSPLPIRGSLPRKGSLKKVSSFSSEGAASPATTNKSLKRSVSFSKLDIREYNIAISDHPSCSHGPPIQLGWAFRDAESVPVELYEQYRQPRRRKSQMVLSYNRRRHLLLGKAGYSSEDLQKAMCEVDRVKRERRVTDLFLPASKLDETMEEVLHRIKRVFGKP